MVEAAGIEPASKRQEPKEPTCLVGVLSLGIRDTRRPVSPHPSLLISPLLTGIGKGYPTEMTPAWT